MDPDAAQKDSQNKKTLLVLFLVFALILIAVLVWMLSLKRPTQESAQTSKKTATTSTQVATKSSKTTKPEDDEALIKKALVAKTGIAENIIDVTVSTKVANFAKGFVGAKGEEVGGGYFLAVKVDGTWIIAFDGQSTPNCTAVDPYNFPASLVPECLNGAGNPVTR